MATTVEAIAARLRDAGCRWAFGIPGGEVLAMMAALDEAGIDFVLAKHEAAAGFMAEGTHRITGAPGILLATIGPGVSNAINVIANAQQDRVPMIFLSGCLDAAEEATYTHQIFDHAQVVRPLVKATFRADPASIATVIDKAVALAMDHPRGPVHIDIPIGAATAMAAPPIVPRRAPPLPVAPAPGPALDQARAWLRAAKAPVIVAGLETPAQGAEAELRDFAHRHRIPVVATYKAKGVLDEARDPWSLGGAGLSPVADRILLPLLARSDFVLLAGYDPIEQRIGWRQPWPADARVVEFASAPNTHYMHQAALSFVCDVGAGLRALGEGIEGEASAWTHAEVAALRGRLRAAYRPDEDWGPAAICDVARRVLPDDTIATTDAGAHRILFSQVWDCPLPNALFQSTGLCTMGCSLPLAAGAKLAAPERVVACFVGDGCFEMVLGELATLRDRALKVIVIVFVDESLALIELKQRASQMPSVGVAFGGTDFAAVARAMGGEGHEVTDRASLEAALRRALVADRFSVLACRIPARSYDGRI
jgi:acetolactate synthase I/II/III large subunit